MATIPLERRRNSGNKWWWLLVIAVVGLVIWLVQEWFDDDYYNDEAFRTRVTSLEPLSTGEGWRGYVGRDVDLDHAQVDRTIGDRAFTIDVGGRPVLVVGDQDDVARIAPGAFVDVEDGRVTPIEDPEELRRLGVDDPTLRDQRFYIRADDVGLAG
jgi:hypothetical protein